MSAVAALPETMPWKHSREPFGGPFGPPACRGRRWDGGRIAGDLFSSHQKVGGSSSSERAAKDLVEAGFCLLRGGVSARNG